MAYLDVVVTPFEDLMLEFGLFWVVILLFIVSVITLLVVLVKNRIQGGKKEEHDSLDPETSES